MEDFRAHEARLPRGYRGPKKIENEVPGQVPRQHAVLIARICEPPGYRFLKQRRCSPRAFFSIHPGRRSPQRSLTVHAAGDGTAQLFHRKDRPHERAQGSALLGVLPPDASSETGYSLRTRQASGLRHSAFVLLSSAADVSPRVSLASGFHIRIRRGPAGE
jgi:hypothetical protein